MDRDTYVEKNALQTRYLRRAFEWSSGSNRRDLHILDTNVDDWQALLDFLREGEYHLVYCLNAERSELPSRVEEIFRVKSPLLIVKLDKIELKCHFYRSYFSPRQKISFELDPSQVNSEPRAMQVFKFMKDVGEALGKDVILTPESVLTHVLYKFDLASGKIEVGLDLRRSVR